MSKRQLNEEEKNISLKSIERTEKELERLNYYIENDKFQLDRFDLTIKITSEMQKEKLEKTIIETQNRIDMETSKIDTLKDQIENGVEEKDGE